MKISLNELKDVIRESLNSQRAVKLAKDACMDAHDALVALEKSPAFEALPGSLREQVKETAALANDTFIELSIASARSSLRKPL